MFKVGDRVKVLKENGHPAVDIDASYVVIGSSVKKWWGTPHGRYYALQVVNDKFSMCEVMDMYVVLDKIFYRKEKLEKICQNILKADYQDI